MKENLLKILVISKFSVIELMRSKILIMIAICSLLVILISYIASELSYGMPNKIALDVGIGLLSISLLAISIFMGATLISKEIENRTLYMILSRPISRAMFLTGRVIGVLLLQALATIILGMTTIFLLKILGGKIEPIIFEAIFFVFLEAVCALLLVIFFSLITNNIAAIIYTIFLYGCSYACVELKEFLYVKNKPFVKNFIEFYQATLPDFTKLNLKDFVFYADKLPSNYFVIGSAYGISYSAFLFFLVIIIFNKKEFH